jgi:DeoR/GlpR family transcriptional regulator of sugar metabolism
MTARRDLRELEKDGLALRTYGGAVLPASAAVDGSFEQRMTEFVETKTRFALATVNLISDNETVFVDSSTAAYFAIRELMTAGRRLTIVTNSLPVLGLVSDAAQVDVVALGGTYRMTTRCFVGPETVRAGRSLHVDKALISIRGLTSDGELSDVDPLEAEVRRTMIEQCSESILFVTAATLTRRGLSVVARLQDITHVLAVDISDSEAQRLSTLTSNLRRL